MQIKERESMLDKTITSKELKANPKINALILGKSKNGKTTSALTLPGKKLLVDTDMRAAAASTFKDVDIIQVASTPKSSEAFNQMKDLTTELWEDFRSEKPTYAAIIYDGLSSMSRIVMDHCLTLRKSDGSPASLGFGGVPAQQHYNPYMAEMSKYIFNTLAMPAHIVWTGHYYIYEDENTNTQEWWPKVFGNIRTEICSWFNEVYACHTTRKEEEGKKDKFDYWWQTASDSKLDFVGSTLNDQNSLWDSPYLVDLKAKKPGFEGLIELTRK